MKVIIAGGRNFHTYSVVKKAIEESGYPITEVVCGCADGVDSLGELWAKQNNIPISRFPADWNKFGRGAGPIRNQQMAEYAEGLIAVWNGKSRGTGDMVTRANNEKLSLFIQRV
jgi:hypothetical protein